MEDQIHAPDAFGTEPIRLIRVWDVGEDITGPYLKSVYHHHRVQWPAQKAMHAECVNYLGQKWFLKIQHRLIQLRPPVRSKSILLRIVRMPWDILFANITFVFLATFFTWNSFATKRNKTHKDFAKCCCGIYGYKIDPANPHRAYRHIKAQLSSYGIVGEVAAWGEVIESQTGMRAEKAYPKVLHAYGPQQLGLVKALAKRYSCEYEYHQQSFADEEGVRTTQMILGSTKIRKGMFIAVAVAIVLILFALTLSALWVKITLLGVSLIILDICAAMILAMVAHQESGDSQNYTITRKHRSPNDWVRSGELFSTNDILDHYRQIAGL